MARAFGRPQRSVRDLYPNFGFGLTTQEQTIPEDPELDLYMQQSTATVDSPNGPRAVRKQDKWGLLLMVAVVVVVLVLLNKS